MIKNMERVIEIADELKYHTYKLKLLSAELESLFENKAEVKQTEIEPFDDTPYKSDYFKPVDLVNGELGKLFERARNDVPTVESVLSNQYKGDNDGE